MNPTRKYFLKLFAFVLVAFAIARIWDFAAIWRPYMLGLAGVLLLLAIVPIIGRPIHIVWEAYRKRTTQGGRFFTGVALFLFVVAYYRLRHVTGLDLSAAPPLSEWPLDDYRWWGLASGITLLIGLISPVADVLFALWMKLAHLIQAVVSKILLAVIFLTVVVPLGILAKLVGKRFLSRGPDESAASYWINREPAEWDPESYQRQF